MNRELHPGAWWIWALGLAAAATFTTNPFVLLMLVATAAIVVALRRSEQAWAGSLRLYVWLGVWILVIRILFRIVFGVDQTGGHVLLNLPEIPLPDWVAGVRLLGPVTRESLLAGAYDGLRLATIVICVGAANSLANPKRLLKSVPPALYEVGTALVVAVTVFPQLGESLRRVRAAQSLRGAPSGRIRGLRRLVTPVLEDALERSLALAAGMDARGYGRAPGLSRGQRRVTGALLLAGLCGLSVGVYAGLDTSVPRWLGWPMLLLGVTLGALGVWSAGRRVTRTRYRPDPWALPEWLVVACGLAATVLMWRVAASQIPIAFPDLAVLPGLSVLALAAPLAGLLPAFLTPAPPTRLEVAA
ncbi:MAG: energy-coupling factor transporter transmembrane component T [Nocardioides sp.]